MKETILTTLTFWHENRSIENNSHSSITFIIKLFCLCLEKSKIHCFTKWIHWSINSENCIINISMRYPLRWSLLMSPILTYVLKESVPDFLQLRWGNLEFKFAFQKRRSASFCEAKLNKNRLIECGDVVERSRFTGMTRAVGPLRTNNQEGISTLAPNM